MNMPGRFYEPVHFTLFTICSALNTNSSKPRGCLYDYGHRLTLYILHYNEAKPSARSILLPSRLALIFSSSRLAPHKEPLHAVVEYDARGEARDDSLKADKPPTGGSRRAEERRRQPERAEMRKGPDLSGPQPAS